MDASGQPSYTYQQRQALEELGLRRNWVLDLSPEDLEEFMDLYKVNKARSGPKQTGLKACCSFSTIAKDQGCCATWMYA